MNNSHSVMDKPESVSLVKPPITIILKIKNSEKNNQFINNLFILLSRWIIKLNISFLNINLKIKNVAMPNKNIIKIRKKLDALDNHILDLIKKRVFLVDQVLKNKKFKKEIVDKKRIRIILKNISNKSKNRKIDPIITRNIWKAMIKAFIDYEFRKFKKKK